MPTTTLGLIEGLEALSRRINEDSLEAARILAEDFLGVAVAGSQTPPGRVIGQYARELGQRGECHVVGQDIRYDAPTAALVNATSGYAIGLTDTHARSITHAGPSIVPTALAVAETVSASGQQMLEAVVLGCEAVVRIGSVVNPDHRRRGFHPTATCNVFGATVTAARLLGLDSGQLANALGLAGSMASGIYEFRHEGSMLMALHAGWPARNGIVAAQLAQRGFSGPTTVLEGPEGFFHAFSDEIHPELLTVDPGHPGVLEIGLRPYNACRYGHSGIDALREIESSNGAISPESIRRVTVWTHSTAVNQETEPSTVVGARLSTKFTVAYAIAHGAKISEVDDADLHDPVVISLMDRMDVLEDPELTAIFPEKWACRVELELVDGRRLTARVDTPKGEPENPMSLDEISVKFHGLTDPLLGRAAANTLEREFLELRSAPEVGGLAAALSGAAVPIAAEHGSQV